MFVRIVKMSFKTEMVDTFLNNFKSHKLKVKASKGCMLLELYRDKNDPSLFFTYSYWQSEKDLENYRNSLIFKEIWAKTKILFDQKPEVWSLDKIVGQFDKLG